MSQCVGGRTRSNNYQLHFFVKTQQGLNNQMHILVCVQPARIQYDRARIRIRYRTGDSIRVNPVGNYLDLLNSAREAASQHSRFGCRRGHDAVRSAKKKSADPLVRAMHDLGNRAPASAEVVRREDNFSRACQYGGYRTGGMITVHMDDVILVSMAQKIKPQA